MHSFNVASGGLLMSFCGSFNVASGDVYIPSLPWLATIRICPLELREGHGGCCLFPTNKKLGTQKGFCAQQSHRVPLSFKNHSWGNNFLGAIIGLIKELCHFGWGDLAIFDEQYFRIAMISNGVNHPFPPFLNGSVYCHCFVFLLYVLCLNVCKRRGLLITQIWTDMNTIMRSCVLILTPCWDENFRVSSLGRAEYMLCAEERDINSDFL